MKNILISVLIAMSLNVCSIHAQNSTGLHLYDNIKKKIYYGAFDNKNSGLSLVRKQFLPLFEMSGDTTDECNMILKDGTLLNEVRLSGADDTSFAILKKGVSRTFRVEQLSRITFVHHGFWKGFAAGAIGSAAFWGLLGVVTYRDGGHPNFGPAFGLIIGLLLAVPTGIVTGIIAEFAAEDDVYDFVNINPQAKSNRLRTLMAKHKQ